MLKHVSVDIPNVLFRKESLLKRNALKTKSHKHPPKQGHPGKEDSQRCCARGWNIITKI
jgi:hypothetical protein